MYLLSSSHFYEVDWCVRSIIMIGSENASLNHLTAHDVYVSCNYATDLLSMEISGN